MHLLKGLIIYFSMYSRIPVPQFEWKEEDMRYTLCFFPWVGAVIGAACYGWACLCAVLSVNELCRSAVGMAIPLFLTGGFHVDGFMDTMDAFHSCRSRERKLEILKDSHIGAFAVIRLSAFGLIWFGALSQVADGRLMGIVCAGFFLARCLSGIGVVSFRPAREDGLLHLFAETAHKRRVRAVLCVQAAVCVCLMAFLQPAAGLVAATAALLALWYYDRRAKKELGGVTGDTAGYFLLICEESILVAAAFFQTLAGI